MLYTIVLILTIPFQDLIPYIEKRDEEVGKGTHVVIFTYGFEVRNYRFNGSPEHLARYYLALLPNYTLQLLRRAERNEATNTGANRTSNVSHILTPITCQGWIRQNLSSVAAHFEGYSVKITDLPQIFTAARGITNVFTSKGVREKATQFPFSNSYRDR